MLPDRVSNPGPLTYESGALPIALRGPAQSLMKITCILKDKFGLNFMKVNLLTSFMKTGTNLCHQEYTLSIFKI